MDTWLIIGLILLIIFAFALSLRFNLFRNFYRKLFEYLNLITPDTRFGDEVDKFNANLRRKSAKM